MSMKWISNPSLLTKFTIASFLITASIGIALAWGIQQQMENNALEHAAEDAATHVATLLDPTLNTSDLSGPLDPGRYEQIDSLVRQSVLNHQIVRVKIWSRDGLLLYSDDKDLVGMRFPEDDELKEALAGEIITIIAPEKEENEGEREEFGRLIEVLVPLRPPGSTDTVGVYEIY